MQKSFRSCRILSFVFGLLLLMAAIIRFVAWRDSGIDGPTVIDDVEWLSFGLAIASSGLFAGGLYLFQSIQPLWRYLSVGCFLLAVAYILTIYADEAQRRVKIRREQAWHDAVGRTQKADPRVLPEGRPEPGPSPWLLWKLGFGIAGTCVLVTGFVVTARTSRQKLSSQIDLTKHGSPRPDQ